MSVPSFLHRCPAGQGTVQCDLVVRAEDEACHENIWPGQRVQMSLRLGQQSERVGVWGVTCTES